MTELRAANFQIEAALGRRFTCKCGREHGTNLEDYVVEAGSAERLPDLFRKHGKKRIFMVADTNTMEACGDTILKILQAQSDLYVNCFVYEESHLVPDDRALDMLLEAGEASPESDVWLAVGSGTLNDLTRYVSFKLGLPYLVFATAPSMDGYASGVSPLILNQMKQTFPAQSPLAIVSDPEILASAPAIMLQAGAGDVFGKFTSLLDWELSRLIFDEYYCPEIVGIVTNSLNRVSEAVPAIRSRDPQAIRLLFDALIEVGIAMDYSGNSRPASGAEHHLAHYWEMQFLFTHRPAVLHGIKVGVALPYVLEAYRQLANLPSDFDFGLARQKAKAVDLNRWKAGTREAYGSAAEAVIALTEADGLQDVTKRLSRITDIEEKWGQVQALARHAIQAGSIYSLYRDLDFPASPSAIGVEDELVRSALLHAKDLRSRYTVLRLLEDIGM